MSDLNPSLEEMEAYAKRHGLTNLTPEQMQRLCVMAGNIAKAGRDVPRVASKFDQPSNVFRVQTRRS